eukprot:CAMPEP_0203862402 /NCGR_PEP_ID=MMETSP0359-20131031/13564_1 /ASSEMBLY_ACC=CAM_ASM_000338 /TAXON_ID=268821 /ORGANISM="Scrippsiella Hangoei, Strain SHTV-5" /LENGTH=368 /DNA_ID=CAMNT_0050779777 /DNA_START=75 /DNA_END=1181 /DNA_ORIENTATION=+
MSWSPWSTSGTSLPPRLCERGQGSGFGSHMAANGLSSGDILDYSSNEMLEQAHARLKAAAQACEAIVGKETVPRRQTDAETRRDRAKRIVQTLPGVEEVYAYLGEGSFGHVLLCKADCQEGDVAVKLVMSASSKMIDRELGAVSQFEHPNLVRLYAAVTVPYVALFLEYCAGGDLKRLLYDGTMAEVRDFLGMRARMLAMLDVARGAQYLHSMSFVHRDIKPANCLLSSVTVAGSELLPLVKLGDFGFCRLVDTDDLPMSIQTGTLWYMAPEVMESSEYGCPADIYSWSILCHEVCTGNSPFHFNPRLKNLTAFTLGISQGIRPRLEEVPRFDGIDELRTTLASCWLASADERPSGVQLVVQVERLVG